MKKVKKDRYTHYPRTILWLIRGGPVLIGGEREDEQPRFECEVAPFYISKWPITNEQFEAFDPSYQRSNLSPGDRDTAVGVGYGAARDYARWYAEVSRKSMRLPTEAEWEYACRGESAALQGLRYFWGEDPLEGDDFVWDAETSGGVVQPADNKKPNEFGLHSMLGGVWEWTSSLYRPYAELDPEAQASESTEGAASEDEARVLRGGSFKTKRSELGCAHRRALDCRITEGPELEDVGFRIVRSF